MRIVQELHHLLLLLFYPKVSRVMWRGCQSRLSTTPPILRINISCQIPARPQGRRTTEEGGIDQVQVGVYDKARRRFKRWSSRNNSLPECLEFRLKTYFTHCPLTRIPGVWTHDIVLWEELVQNSESLKITPSESANWTTEGAGSEPGDESHPAEKQQHRPSGCTHKGPNVSPLQAGQFTGRCRFMPRPQLPTKDPDHQENGHQQHEWWL